MPTTNPVPSTDPSDLLFNAGKLDEVVNGAGSTYTDRLGVARRTLAGIDAAADNVLNSIGYAVPVAYASGISLTLTSQTIEFSGVVYSPKSSALPFTTSSWGADSAKFRAIQVTDAAHLSYQPAGTGAIATTVQEQLRRGSVQAENYGADPTGVSDSTDAIVTAFATGKDVKLTSGTYLLSPAAVKTIADQGYQRLYGDGSVTIKVNLTSSSDVFLFNGPVSLENLTIDFNNSYSRYAFRWGANAGHIRIKDIRVGGLKDIDSSTGSITFWIIETGNTFEINNVKAYSMLKRGNGTITDANGSYTLIYIGGGTGPTEGSIDNVFVNTIHNINASDQVIYEDTAAIYIATGTSDAQNKISINNVQGVNFGKRLLKIHASNVTVDGVNGYSTEGDSLGVITFLNGLGLGDKYGCSASNVRAYGKMEYAFSSEAIGTKWNNVIAYTEPGTKTGMDTAAIGLWIQSNDTVVDGYESGSQRLISIGSSASIVKNTKLKNLKFDIAAITTQGLQPRGGSLGFDGLTVDGLKVIAPAGNQVAAIAADTVLNGTTVKGRNVVIDDVLVETAFAGSGDAFRFKYIENISVSNLRYVNTSGQTHFRIASFDTCKNVNVDKVDIEGANTIGVYLLSSTGRNTANRIYNPSATIAAVYNSNSSDVFVGNCDPAKVSSITTNVSQNSKNSVGATIDRPTTGLVAGYSQHFDTTLGKPIWWSGSVWKDATGATV